MSEEITPNEGHPEVNTEGTTEAGSQEEQQGTDAQSPENEGERKLDPAELQKTVNRLFNEKNDLAKRLEALENLKAPNNELGETVNELKRQLEEATFYSNNPQYANYKDIIASMGKDPAQVVQSETFKKVYDKTSAYDKLQESKSVLQSNPRLGVIGDKITEAKKAASEGNVSHAIDSAVDAVIDTFKK